jgi:osmotically-inducible protein OsmY
MSFMKNICLSLMIFLVGCMPVMMAGATTGFVIYDKRPMATIRADIQIFHDINEALHKDKRFKDGHISVYAFNQDVLLVGQTPYASNRELAVKIAATTRGVQHVYNEISLEYPIAYTTRVQDTWITSEIKSLMLAKKGLASGSIRVVTENRVVYMMGNVNSQQAQIATNVARKVKGVNKVVKVFKIS